MAMDEDLKHKEELRQRIEQALQRKAEKEAARRSAEEEQKRLDAEKAKAEIEEARRIIEAERKRVEAEKVKEAAKQREEFQERIEKADSNKRKVLIVVLIVFVAIVIGAYCFLKKSSTDKTYDAFIGQNWEELTFEECVEREKQFEEIFDLPFLSSVQELELQYAYDDFEEMFLYWINEDLGSIEYYYNRDYSGMRKLDELGEYQNVEELTFIREAIERLSLVPQHTGDFVPKKYLDELEKLAKANDLYYDLRTKSYKIYKEKNSTVEEFDDVCVVDEEADNTIYEFLPPPPPLSTIEEESFVEDEENISISIKDVESEDEKIVEDDNDVLVTVEEMPTFPGGQRALLEFIANNVKYPAFAQENGIQGRVVLRFVVEKDGSVGDVEILRGVDPSLDTEAIRVVKLLPRFTPGKQNGRLVRVWYTLPVSFKLM